MSKTYQYAGLTPELHQRLVNERVALKLAHLRDYKQHFQKVRQCSEKQAIIILQALNSAVVERARISPQTVDRLEGIIDIARYVFNRYEWPESLDSEVDRITLEYRTKGKLGRNKATVRKALYTAYALGV